MSSPVGANAPAAAVTGASPAQPTGFTRTAVLLHWFMAALILGGFTLGTYMVDLHMSPTKLRLFAYHKWIGITVLGLVVVRSLWRLTHAPPPEVPMPRWQLLAARGTHLLLYALMIVTPIFGWMYSSAAGVPVVYLKLWQLPDLVHKNKELADVLKEIHGDLGWALGWIVLLHAAAAVKHHFVDRDVTLRRMLSWRRT